MEKEACKTIWHRIQGLTIHTRVSTAVPSHAQAVVLIHGLGVSAEYMLPTLIRLGSRYQVWAPDLPGFGLSDKPKHALDIPDLADVLAEWVTTVGLHSAVFLGNSIGCQVIIDLAVRYPVLVDSAILVGPTVDSVGRTMIRQLWRGLCDLIHEPWSLWRILARDYLRTGTRRILRTFRFALKDCVEQKCPSITVPTLIVRGSRDTIAPTRWIEELASLIPNAHIAVISGGTHASNYSAPDELARVMRDFVESCASRGQLH